MRFRLVQHDAIKTREERRCSATDSKPPHYVEVSGSASRPGSFPKMQSPVFIKWETGWAPGAVGCFGEEKISLRPESKLIQVSFESAVSSMYRLGYRGCSQ